MEKFQKSEIHFDNLVDLEKCCKMSIWTQKSALIQLRTSLLKFDDLAEKSERSSVSNLSTKLSTTIARMNAVKEERQSLIAVNSTGYTRVRGSLPSASETTP